MGRLTLTELAYLLVTRREPTPPQRRLLDAVLVSLADHGLTPSALAARLTYTGAPEAIQGAVAAGLLGAGQRVPRPGRRHRAVPLRRAAGGRRAGTTLRRRDAAAIAETGGRRPARGRRAGPRPRPSGAQGRRPAHAAALRDRRRRKGLLGPHLRLLEHVAAVNEERSGKHLPVNGAGAGGAALVDLGLPPSSARGVVLIARTAGLVAHLVEEAEQPVGMPLWLEVERRSERD